MNKNEHPASIFSAGGIYGIDPKECAQETPNTQTSLFKYSDGKVLEFETRGRYTHGEGSLNVLIGNLFYGTDGYLELNGNTWKAFRKREREPFAGSGEGQMVDVTSTREDNISNHPTNFIEAIRSGKDSDLHCDISEGFLSSSLPILANISYRLGRELKFDGKTEKFVKEPEADKMLTRDYRKPYVVPGTV